jgi:hypothetical protein
MNNEVLPKKIFTKLVILILVLLLLNAIGIVVEKSMNVSPVTKFAQLFNSSYEASIPTYFSIVALVFASLLLYLIAVNHKRQSKKSKYWLGLSILFLYLSIDEFLMIHERTSILIQEMLNTSGYLYYAWVIPYGLISVIITFSYKNFLKDLPRKIMILFVVSGLIFVVGSISFEMLAGKHVEVHGKNTITNYILSTSEEYFEMFGVVLFIYALLLYISDQIKVFNIKIKE